MMNNTIYDLVLRIVKASLWDNIPIEETMNNQVYNELKYHAVLSLSAPVLSKFIISKELYKKWQKSIIQQLSYNVRNRYEQNGLPIYVPYVVLKGTSAAQYYPHPELRALGDIDIMTKREDYDKACQSLIDNGYTEKTAKSEAQLGRHRSFIKNGIVVEVHAFFALLNDAHKAKYFDDLIIYNINTMHILADNINGLVLLEHIDQHLEDGLGLRHIIDWMMYVDKYLTDDKWCEFQKNAKKIGLEKLAKVTTRMCEMYLGLPDRKWCKDVNDSICEKFMDYILSCGNFGVKREKEIAVGERFFIYARGPRSTLRFLQERGLINWKAAQKCALLRPFAWIYQMGRYIIKGFRQNGASATIKKEYVGAKEKNALFDLLGVKQKAKGIVVYRNGKYIRK